MALSLPLRERGLKYSVDCNDNVPVRVAPLAGAWIEIPGTFDPKVTTYVAPLAGAWIEIQIRKPLPDFSKSLPLRERGLKYQQ